MRLSEEQVKRFREDGVLLAEGVVTDDDLAPVIAEISAFIDARARQLHAGGTIADLAEDADFEHRFARLYAQDKAIGDGMDIMAMRGPATFAFLRNANLLDAVESLLGTPEITCNPIQHLRGKVATPEGAGGFFNTPWHQDIGVTWDEADDSDIITCWMPLVDATIENGAMQILPGVWERGFLPHHRDETGDTAIHPDALPKEVSPIAGTVKKGGVVFMDRRTPHRSTRNTTDGVRWSLDLRYQPTGQPTGRPFHPDFIARSAAHPENVLTDHAEWSRRWVEALSTSQNVRAHRVK